MGIPHAFEGTGIVFGVGYLVVICVHLLLFTQSDALAGVLRLAPFNIASALLILAAGFAHGPLAYGLWVAGWALMVVVPYLLPRHSWVGVASAFHISAAHFVERHGLLVIVALGESVVAIGMGVDVQHLDAGTLGAIVFALALPGAIWWTYFTDTGAAEHSMDHAELGMRSRLAVRAYMFAHIPMLLGIVTAAAGIHGAIAHPGDPAEWRSAVALAGGVALFLCGIAEFRRCLVIGSPWSRLVAAVAALATIPIGTMANAGLHLASVVAVLVVMLVIDRRNARAVHTIGTSQERA